MPRKKTTDLAEFQADYDTDAYDEERGYVSVLGSLDIADEALDDLTFPMEESERSVAKSRRPQGKRGPALTEEQQRQVAVWIVEGFTYKQAKEFMTNDWGFHVTETTWRYYKLVRQDLLDWAAKFLESQYNRFGFASHAMRLKELNDLARSLKETITKRGFYETDIHTTGFGKDSAQVTTEKFAQSLVKEYREVIAQIEKMTAPMERALDKARGDMRVTLEEDAAARVLAAANYKTPLLEGERN